MAFLERVRKLFGKRGRFFSYGADLCPLPRGNGALFFAQKKRAKRSVQPCRLTAAPINGPARAFLFPKVRCVSGECTCTRKQGYRIFGSRADFANLIGALVSIRVHHANRLASHRRDANARWFVGSKVEICFLRGYGGKREFSCH